MIKIPSNIFTRLFYSPKSRFIAWAQSPQNRYILYKAMFESESTFLCDKFTDVTGYHKFINFSLPSVIDSLPELKGECTNSPKFISFNASFWFNTKDHNKDIRIRQAILRKCVNDFLKYE